MTDLGFQGHTLDTRQRRTTPDMRSDGNCSRSLAAAIFAAPHSTSGAAVRAVVADDGRMYPQRTLRLRRAAMAQGCVNLA